MTNEIFIFDWQSYEKNIDNITFQLENIRKIIIMALLSAI